MKFLQQRDIPDSVLGLAQGGGPEAERVRSGLRGRPVVLVCSGLVGDLLVPPGAAAWTLGHYILIRARYWSPASHTSALLLAHELVHAAQWEERGALRFLVGYVGGYVRLRLRGMGHDDAYRSLPEEVEAFSVQAELEGPEGPSRSRTSGS